MKTKSAHIFKSSFEEDVYKGLMSFPKKLSSKYIYDSEGDKLFQQIMQLPEYYLTRCEYEILNTEKTNICKAFDTTQEGFDLIELGAGDGTKTKVLLKELTTGNYSFTYKPIDISQNALDQLQASIHTELPKVAIAPQQGMYFEVLKQLKSISSRKKVIMMLGSNLGNLPHPMAIDFLKQIKEAMNPNDLLFMGLDMKKHPQQIINAYNDPKGVTAAFNKNLLHRINKELDANFNLANFMHWETYDPETGTAKSYLVATKKQEVDINALDMKVKFDEWETIHTEISQKYDDTIVKWLANQTGLNLVNSFTDAKKCFKNYLFKSS
ncbi:L-histidine N(alpha)-methyltransferase [Neptunitalea lumnitzerae]|uniref:Dimethylhistidine N-methyltransferase n=1 Tax=Neptunitalea lumnitzerae TaxID=2965509 RepID=A0ABQ5MHZ2_9FLAO|nr:L-histidine N(alpha)-methyltransferase [Neptunitalea sp. Y10]GLB49014.1 dimethylhistidine N-methyltransferase [Neptunitalea sp. Y10]